MSEELKVALWALLVVPLFVAANVLWVVTDPAGVAALLSIMPDSVSQYGLIGVMVWLLTYIIPCLVTYYFTAR